MFYIAALTGRSGTGKSYASEYLSRKGIPTVDGDIMARRATQPGSRCLRELVEEFSTTILKDDGSLDRQGLADLCFSDPKRKRRLDEITHPHIIKLIMDECERLRDEGFPFCLIEAAALVESGLYTSCNRIILVTAPREIQIARLMARDEITEAQAARRIDAQVDETLLRELADEVIENGGSPAEFERRLDKLADELRALA